MVRHLVTIRRIMFHHHILTREKSELIQKVYFKQKETKTKGDWLQLIEEDFEFIGEQMDEEKIKSTPKEEYRKLIKEKVEKAAFSQLIELKNRSKTKMKDLHYQKLKMQSYMKNGSFNQEEIRLLFSLWSKSYLAKINYRKMNKGNLICTFLL